MTELRRRMTQDLQIRNYSPKTVKIYLGLVGEFAKYFGRPPDQLGPEDVRRFQVYLVEEKKVSSSYLKQYVAALRFFFGKTLGRDVPPRLVPYPRKKKSLPVVLSPGEVLELFKVCKNVKHRVILMTTYSAGLRLSEVANLRIVDIDSARMKIRVQEGKGRKDRYLPLSERLLGALREYWLLCRPCVWLFPGAGGDRPIPGRSIQKICRKAVLRAGLRKRVTVHTLRHSFATHHLEGGTDMMLLKELMGHTSLNTTSHYTHLGSAALDAVKSPLDRLPPID